MSTIVYYCLLLSPIVYYCLLLSTIVYYYLLLSTIVSYCLLLSTIVSYCLLLSTIVYYCLLLSTIVYYYLLQGMVTSVWLLGLCVGSFVGASLGSLVYDREGLLPESIDIWVDNFLNNILPTSIIWKKYVLIINFILLHIF